MPDDKVELQAQIVLLTILVVSIVSFLIGTVVGPTSDLERVRGFLGYNSEL